MDRAEKQIAKQIERRQTQLIAWAMNQRNRAIEMALEARKFDIALTLMQDRDKLLGLYPEERPRDNPTQVNNQVVLSEADRRALCALAESRIGQSAGPGAAGGGPEPRKLPPGTASVP